MIITTKLCYNHVILTLTQYIVLSWKKEAVCCSEILACWYGSPDLAYQFGNEEEGTGRADRTGLDPAPAAGCIDSTTDSFVDGEERRGSGQR